MVTYLCDNSARYGVQKGYTAFQERPFGQFRIHSEKGGMSARLEVVERTFILVDSTVNRTAIFHPSLVLYPMRCKVDTNSVSFTFEMCK